jgi:hypothetical protein
VTSKHRSPATRWCCTPPIRRRSSGFGFYDAKAHRSFCGFGNDRAAYRDLAALGYASL